SNSETENPTHADPKSSPPPPHVSHAANAPTRCESHPHPQKNPTERSPAPFAPIARPLRASPAATPSHPPAVPSPAHPPPATTASAPHAAPANHPSHASRPLPQHSRPAPASDMQKMPAASSHNQICFQHLRDISST